MNMKKLFLLVFVLCALPVQAETLLCFVDSYSLIEGKKVTFHTGKEFVGTRTERQEELRHFFLHRLSIFTKVLSYNLDSIAVSAQNIEGCLVSGGESHHRLLSDLALHGIGVSLVKDQRLHD